MCPRNNVLSKNRRILFRRILDGILVFSISWTGNSGLSAQQATIRESSQRFRTYPFSDPSPVPRMNTIYPYFRFDGYSDEGSDVYWKIITLENPCIRVLIAPEMGGKILGGFEKTADRPFIYFNKVIKFRDIAMRGPWTSGGIEFNFGAIGHAPTTATPVDYFLRENEDGSVSCFVGALDLPSRTEWRVEIRLDKDKACFETRSFWYNPTPLHTSLYQWMNSSADARSDLKYFFPGSRTMDHGGQVFSWPLHKNGRDISIYGNNDFGSYKSYHVFGTYTDFFGGIYQNDRFGFGHWSLFSDKPGKKIWIWGLSRQGQIWENLLTDTDLGNRQYTEIQSGLLFNQAGGSSTQTPFKHDSFSPYTDQQFTELWFPVKGMSGLTAVDRYGALHVIYMEDQIKIEYCPLQNINQTISIHSQGKTAYQKELLLSPMEAWTDSTHIPDGGDIEIYLDARRIYSQADDRELSRPNAIRPDFDWTSVFGLFTSGIEKARQREYSQALDYFLACLRKNPAYTPALTGCAEVFFRRMEYEKALDTVREALALDAYDPDANFMYGVVSRKLGRRFDAMDGFGFAARSMKYRSASNLQLAELAFLDDDMERAETYAHRALNYNRFNLHALRLLAVKYRKAKETGEAQKVLTDILKADPLCHFVRFENYLHPLRQKEMDDFTSLIRCELPCETYLELAMYYFSLGLTDEAATLLQIAPRHPMISYWLAYLFHQKGNGQNVRIHLAKALTASPERVFPFRPETAEVLAWALTQKNHWKTKYYLALIHWHTNQMEKAGQYFEDCRENPDFAPFYLTRGNFFRSTDAARALADYEKALKLDDKLWRVYHTLSEFYSDRSDYSHALACTEKGIKKCPENDILQFDYARALLHNRDYEKCLFILDKITILPHEGAQYGRDTYRQACLLSALEKMKRGHYPEALSLIEKAKEWPENLGVGKPYDVDIRLEHFIEAHCRKNMGDPLQADTLFKEIVAATGILDQDRQSVHFIGALALRALNREEEADRFMQIWMDQQPESITARWAAAVFRREHEAAESILKSLQSEDRGTPWNPAGGDPDFRLVIDTVTTIDKLWGK